MGTFFRLTALDVADHFFAIESLRTAKEACRGEAPIYTVQAQVLCQPVLKFVFSLGGQREGKKADTWSRPLMYSMCLSTRSSSVAMSEDGN